MSVPTTMDAPVDLEGDLLPLPFTRSPSEPFSEVLSERFGSSVDHATQDFEVNTGDAWGRYPEHTVAPRITFLGLGTASDLDAEVPRMAGAARLDVAFDCEAETVSCLVSTEDQLSDGRTGQALVEGFSLSTYRSRPYRTADGIERPSAYLMQGGDNHDYASVDEVATHGRHLAEKACTARDLLTGRTPRSVPTRSRCVTGTTSTWRVTAPTSRTSADARPTQSRAALNLRFGF